MTQSRENNAIPIEIDVHEVKRLFESKAEFLLVAASDRRTSFCRIEGSQLIPMNETPSQLSELEGHREKRIVVYCHHGGRSLYVTQWLRAQGFDSVQNMTGGIDVWSQIIDPDIPRY